MSDLDRVSMPTKPSLNTERLRSWLFLGTLTGVLLFGGASRADALSQPIVRFLALAAVAAAIVLQKADSRPVRLPVGYLLAVAAVIAVQLIPLAPSLWQSMPPREALIPALSEVGLAHAYRPLSVNPDATVNALLALLPALAVVLTAALAPIEAHRRAIGLVLLFTLLSAILGIFQVYSGKPYFFRITNDTSAVGLFANRNHFALLLAIGLPFVAVWARRSYGGSDVVRFRRWLGLCAAIATIPMLVAAGSRAGLALGLAGAVLALAISRRELGAAFASRARALWLAVPVAAGVAITALLLIFSRGESVSRLFDEEGSELRLTMLPYTLAMARDSFPWGIGAGSFPSVFRMYEPTEVLTRFYLNHAHNDPLEVVIELGLAGAILLLAFAAWAATRAVAIWRNRERRQNMDLGRLGTVVVGLAIAASAVDYPLRTPAMGGLFALACCWMLRQWHEPVGRAGEAPSSTRAPRSRHRQIEGFAGPTGGRS